MGDVLRSALRRGSGGGKTFTIKHAADAWWHTHTITHTITHYHIHTITRSTERERDGRLTRQPKAPASHGSLPRLRAGFVCQRHPAQVGVGLSGLSGTQSRRGISRHVTASEGRQHTCGLSSRRSLPAEGRGHPRQEAVGSPLGPRVGRRVPVQCDESLQTRTLWRCE
jgi:hypothetical protein